MDPGSVICAALVRSAAKIIGQPVKASELFDLGEDEPIAPSIRTHRHPRNGRLRKRYDTRLDKLLRRLDVSLHALSRECGVSRQGLRRVRGRFGISVSTIAAIVKALRRMGYPVNASDVEDVGES
jgi:hypothetical protein